MHKYVPNSYDKCLKCARLGDGCDGPNTLSMTLERWCEWCRELKYLRKMTIQEISEKSGVSIKTVERVIAGSVTADIRRATASDITRVLVGSAGRWPCWMEGGEVEALEELEQSKAELEEMRRTLAEIRESYKAELAAVREESQRKIDYLKLENERKDKVIDRLLGAK